MTEEIRTFIAAHIPEETREKIYTIRRLLRNELKSVRWINSENLHLTLKFLGNISPDSSDKIAEVLDNSLDEFSGFNMNLSGLGVFPDERRPRVIWAGLDGELSRLSVMADKINKSLISYDLGSKKNHFTPHITIGRFNKNKTEKNILNIIEKYSSMIDGYFLMDEIILYESRLTEKGAIYTPIFKKRLKK
ncbi:MAG: RNA 2',3'-cyclic phosphodiesterase [Thermodesulfobacteriota bacterium]